MKQAIDSVDDWIIGNRKAVAHNVVTFGHEFNRVISIKLLND